MRWPPLSQRNTTGWGHEERGHQERSGMKVYLAIAGVALSVIGVLVAVLFGVRVLRTLVEWFREWREHGPDDKAVEGGTNDA